MTDLTGYTKYEGDDSDIVPFDVPGLQRYEGSDDDIIPATEADKKELTQQEIKAQELQNSQLRKMRAGEANKDSKFFNKENTPNVGKLRAETAFDRNPFWLGQDIAGGAWNGVVNTAETLSGASELANKAVDNIKSPFGRGVAKVANHVLNPIGSFLPEGTAQAIEENVPKYHPEPTLKHQLVTGGAELGVGMVGPQKFLKVGELQGAVRLLANLGKFAAVNGGGVAAMDPDVRPLITGDNAEFANVLGNLGVDPNTGEYNEKLLKQKLQVLGEAAMLAKPAEIAARSGAWVGKFFWDAIGGNLFNWKNMSAMERQHAEDIFGQLANIGADNSPQQIREKAANIAQKLKQGAKFSQPSGIEGVDDVNHIRPSMEALVKGGEGELAPIDVARAKGIQSAGASRKLPELDVATAQPNLALEKASNQTREVFGGAEGAEKARQAVLNSANKDIANYDTELARQEQLAKTKDKDLSSLVENDPFLGDTIKNAQGGIQLNLRNKVNDAADALVQEHNEAKGAIKSKVKDEYQKAFDMADQEDAMAERFSFENEREKVDDILPSNVKKMLDKWGGDWVTLQKEVYPELSKAANQIYKTDPYNGSRLRAFANHIRDAQPEVVSEETANQLTQAHKTYKEELAPYKQGLSEDLSEIQRNAGFDKTTGKPLRPDELAVQSRKALKGAFNDPDQIEHTKKVLSLIKDPAKKTNYILGNFAEDMADEIATKGISSIEPTKIAASLRPYAEILEPAEAQRLEKFINDFSSKKQDVEASMKQLDVYRKDFQDAKDEIMKEELGNFFTKQGLQNRDADQVFTKFLNDKEGSNQIRQLVNRINSEGSQEARDGLKAAYAKYFKEKVFDNVAGPAGEKRINIDTANKAFNNTNKLLEFGRIIHSDNPIVMDLYENVLKEASHAYDFTKAGQVPVRDISSFDKGARSAFDMVITQVFGQLNRWGARLRAIAGRAVSLKPSKEMNLDAYGAVLSDPYKLADLIEEVGNKKAKLLSSDFKKRLFTWGVVNGLYRPEDKDKLLGVEDQTEKAFKK